MSKSSVQTVWSPDSEGVAVSTPDRELEDLILPRARTLVGFIQGVWARFTDGQRSSSAMTFQDRHSAAALIGLFGIKHG